MLVCLLLDFCVFLFDFSFCFWRWRTIWQSISTMMVRRVRCGSDDEPDDFAEEEVKISFFLCVSISLGIARAPSK